MAFSEEIIGRGYVEIIPDMRRFGSEMRAAQGGLLRSLKIVGAVFGVALVAGLAESTKKAVEFQTEMTKIQTQAGGTAKDVKVLSKAVLDMGATTQQGPQKLAEALFHLKSVGMDNVDAMKSLRVASDLAAVGGSDLEKTTNALAGAWRSGIRGAQTFGQAAGTVNAIIGAGNMRMADFVAAIGTGILPSAKSFGLSLSQVGAALALMTDEGIGAREAATRLRMSFSLLGAPSKAAEKQLNEIGLTGLDLANAMRGPDGLIGAIQLLKDHLDASGLSAAKQSILLSHAFGGGRSSSAILTMINNLDVLKLKQEQINKTTGEFSKAVEAQRKTAQAQFALLRSSLDVLAIRIGSAFLPVLVKFVVFLDRVGIPAITRFGNALVHNLFPAGALNTVGQQFSAFLDGLLGRSPKAPRLASFVPSPTGAARSMSSPGFSTGGPLSPARVPSASAFAASTTTAKNFGDTLRQTLSYLIQNLKPLAQAALDIAGAFSAIILHTPVPVFKAIVDILVTTMIAKKIIALALAFKELKTAMEFGAAGKFGVIFGALVGITMAIDRMGGRASNASQAIGEIFHAFTPSGFMKTFSPVVPMFDAIGHAFAVFGRAVAYAIGNMSPFFHLFTPSEFMKTFSPVAPVFDAIGRALVVFGQAIAYAVTNIGPFFKAIFSIHGTVSKAFAGANHWLLGVGSDIIGGLVSGAKAAFGAVEKWFSFGIRDSVVGWLMHSFGIGSPAKVMIPIGEAIIQGILVGAMSVARTIGGWLTVHVYNPVNGFFSRAASWLVAEGRSIINGLLNGLGAVARTLGGWLSAHVRSPIMGAFGGAGGWLVSAGRAVLNGLFTGLKQPWGAITKWVSGVAGWIKAHKGPVSLDGTLLHPAGVALMNGLLNGLKFGFGPVGSFIYKMGSTVAGTTKGILANLMSPIAGGQGVNRWKNVVLAALKMAGQPASLLNVVLRRMNQESGGNPTIVNTTDSNWTAGHPSVGLMQVIKGTYAQYAGQFRDTGPFSYGVSVNPLANIYASMEYALSRYGSLASAYNRAGGYDSGGWLPQGLSLAYNGTGHPERIRTAGQEAALQRSMAGHGSSSGLTVNVNVGNLLANRHDIAQAVTVGIETARRQGYVLPRSLIPKVS